MQDVDGPGGHVDLSTIAARFADGAQVQDLSRGSRAVGANRVYRIGSGSSSRIVKAYGTTARYRRERHALEALTGIEGIPRLLDGAEEEDASWLILADAGRFSLATLPENPGLAVKAGEILRRVHDSDPRMLSNLARGIDQEWVAVDFMSTFRRLERFRGKLGLAVDLLDAAKRVRPPYASPPVAAHTDPRPELFLVDEEGALTLIHWEWATLAPPEWDLSKAVWLAGVHAGETVGLGIQTGYGRELDTDQLDRWTVYHSATALVHQADRLITGSMASYADMVAQLESAVVRATSGT